MKVTICDFCKKESNNTTEYVFPEYVTYEAKDKEGNILIKFPSDEIHRMPKDVCPNCANKIARLLASMR